MTTGDYRAGWIAALDAVYLELRGLPAWGALHGAGGFDFGFGANEREEVLDAVNRMRLAAAGDSTIGNGGDASNG